MTLKTSLVASLCALAFAGCGAGLDAELPPAPVAHASSTERLAVVRRVDSVESDACEVVPRRSTSDASGRHEGFTMATVRCAWPVTKPKRSARATSDVDATLPH